MDDKQNKRLLELLYFKLESEGTSLYALLDGARSPRVLKAIAESGLDHECLLAGDLEPVMKAAAPYIVRLRHGMPASEKLIREAWGQSWGMFVASRMGMRMVRHHLRSLWRVRTEAGRNLFFRYFDPRVLRIFLPACSPDQLWQVFGPIQRFDMEAPDSGQLLRFRIVPVPGGDPQLRSWSYELAESDNAVDDQGPVAARRAS